MTISKDKYILLNWIQASAQFNWNLITHSISSIYEKDLNAFADT